MREHLVFYVNGDRHTVAGDAAALTLSDYLRTSQPGAGQQRLTGTKIACAEGDCGACTVLVGAADFASGRFEYRTIDACIAFVFQMDRRHVITVEGLGVRGDLTPVQQAMVDGHGSQCGFCTPGFVMAIQGCQAKRGDLRSMPENDLREELAGNLCRCTGYQQILDACRTIGPGSAIGLDNKFDPEAMLRDLGKLGEEAVILAPSNGSPDATRIMLPRSVDQLIALRSKHPEARLVAGATDLGVQHNHGRYSPKGVIVTSQVDELRSVQLDGDQLTIGAAATWDEVYQAVKDRVPEYAKILSRFGSPQVRHCGTLAGNLANASPIADSIPFHMVAESTIEAASTRGVRPIPINDFYLGYKEVDLAADEVIARVVTTLPTNSVQLKLYKISKRRDMDISTVTAAFWLQVVGGVISEARVAVGGVGPIVLRLPDAEHGMVGKPLTEQTMRSAGEVARGEVSPITDVRGSANYRLQLVENLFAKCYHDLTEAAPAAGMPA